MRKQARRLWLGDWQRGDEPPLRQPEAADPDQPDSVVITPDDDGDAQAVAAHRGNMRRAVAGGAAVAALCALVFALSSRNDDRPQGASAQTPPAQTPQPQPQVPQPQGAPGFGGPDLTGAEATKAAQAAVTKFPGNVERVTRGPTGGGYIVHVIQSDGNEVHVLVDDHFRVRGSDADSTPRALGRGTRQ